MSKPRSPIEILIDQATGYEPPPAPKLTPEQEEACAQLGRDVLSDLRYYYPNVVKTRPTTWPIHLRNTIAAKARAMLQEQIQPNGPI